MVLVVTNGGLRPGGRLFSSCFTDRTWGVETGPAIETGGFAQATEGPLAGKGFSRFLGRTQIRQLYEPLEVTNVELTSYTMEGMARLVELWLITCAKAPIASVNECLGKDR